MGAAVGLGGSGGSGGGGGGVSAEDPVFDGDVEAVTASIAEWMFEDVAALRRELETRDTAASGSLSAEEFAAAVAAAGRARRFVPTTP